MSKGLRHLPIERQRDVIRRRLSGKEKGNGYWAAMDAAKILGISVSVKHPAPRA